jgi:hypothetical protein
VNERPRWRRNVPSSVRQRLIAGEWSIVVIAVAAIVLLAGPLGLIDAGAARVSREAVEKGGERAMLSSGGGVVRLTCPDDLERMTGAKIVCRYTDSAAEAARVATRLENPPRPRIGRVEIRITGFHATGSGAGTASEPEFAARVTERPH